MQGSGNPSSWTTRLFRASAYLFGAVVLLQMTLAIAKTFVWVGLAIVVVVTAVVAIRWWWRNRSGWG